MLDKNKLNIILAVQSYTAFVKSESVLLSKNLSSCEIFEEVEQFYFSIPKDTLLKASLTKNRIDFEKVYYFKVYDYMLNCSVDELGKIDCYF